MKPVRIIADVITNNLLLSKPRKRSLVFFSIYNRIIWLTRHLERIIQFYYGTMNHIARFFLNFDNAEGHLPTACADSKVNHVYLLNIK